MLSDSLAETSFKDLFLSLNPCSNGICSLTFTNHASTKWTEVLILVLMEYALWPKGSTLCRTKRTVLILVLMEYALWQQGIESSRWWRQIVLILVLMEYALWQKHGYEIVYLCGSLNPCSNGICSLTNTKKRKIRRGRCLNPCSNGICSLTFC